LAESAFDFEKIFGIPHKPLELLRCEGDYFSRFDPSNKREMLKKLRARSFGSNPAHSLAWNFTRPI
jgi:hypothetical protein